MPSKYGPCYYCGGPSSHTIILIYGEDEIDLCSDPDCIRAYGKQFGINNIKELIDKWKEDNDDN